ncbi:ribosome small subunit-dependent GTPase A [Acidipropionibacterium acidipropionici]|uniref:Small ribosomal subunit biogenesis GTPase RsgA n=2 Tax=Acidipropionibacterium acidipropionici TaxID=1748 RepID=A0A142KE11_9ACTN|nr:ribosome small subunit-dependent GTPase A [Acidipropionibacterium acidipropionici]AFV89784.1 Ribosome small subunit-dependent GTPase A [Acidipropionibacterium acidipropionici ATCC 4875]ALN15856.1 GTPase [Acidipropionibacterium acidipropionici]AMS04349.1 GTPase [Acidipropionibacterium acidipropionici]AOZ45843.1 ribosome small subunit-dependent GTPase A [Acidipropionibacterium acidipropionici]APZ08398.1 ribosome small subunit-dependent GTPase A [Acidipropionibacterium acidipropionici]
MSPRRLASSGVDTFDEDGYERPRRRTRPRTKNRPDYSGLPVGTVLSIDRGRYRCRVEGQDVTAAKARGLGRKGVIVGDRVRLDGDISGDEGSLARIAETMRRRTVLRRTADDTDPYERPVVANADQILIVTALADPPPRIGMIDRILVASYEAGTDPVLCLTKADLASPRELTELYSPLGVPVVTSSPGADLGPIRERLAGLTTVLVGHSGVGKSTLINALIPGVDRRTGQVNEVTGRGRHTSTSAQALELPDGGWVIDTPGVRSFGLSHVSSDHVLSAFPDLEAFTVDCPRGCRHTAEDPQCGLDEALRAGRIPALRLASFRRLDAARTR